MAEFAAISYDMQERDPEFLTLEPDYRHCWLCLLAVRWPKCGICKKVEAEFALSQKTGRPVGVVKSALAEFERLGWIQSDGEYILIRAWIKHRANSSNWLAGAEQEAALLQGKTGLAELITALCAEKRRLTPFKGTTLTAHTAHTEQLNPSVRPVGRPAKPESDEDVKTARQIEAYIAEKIAKHKTKTGRLDNSDHQAIAREIRLLRTVEGLSVSDIRATLDYAWNHSLPGGQLYGEVLLSIKKWREKGKFQRAYQQAMNQRAESAQPKTPRYGQGGPPEGFDYPNIEFDRGVGK